MKLDYTRPTSNPNTVQMLTRFKAWSDEAMFQSLSTVSEEELLKERPTTFKTILQTMNHIFVVDDIFKAHLEGVAHGYTARYTDIVPDLETLWSATVDMDQWYIDLSDSLSDAGLREVVEFEFIGGGNGAMTREQIINHLVNHDSNHHGFISDMMYHIPAPLPTYDLPVFLRDVWNTTE